MDNCETNVEAVQARRITNWTLSLAESRDGTILQNATQALWKNVQGWKDARGVLLPNSVGCAEILGCRADFGKHWTMGGEMETKGPKDALTQGDFPVEKTCHKQSVVSDNPKSNRTKWRRGGMVRVCFENMVPLIPTKRFSTRATSSQTQMSLGNSWV